MNNFHYRDGYPTQSKIPVSVLLTILAVAELCLLVGAFMVSR